MKITIIGNGQIGNAILYLLKESSKNKKEELLIDMYDKNNSKNTCKKTLEDSVGGSDFVFLCVPSWYLDKILKEISSYIKKDTIFISLSKGIDTTSQESVDELIEKNIKKAKYALISGPMFAKEIIDGKMSFGVLATKDRTVAKKIMGLFTDTKLKMEYSKRVHSVAIAGVLKNIYTLAISIVDNSMKDNNIKGFLTVKAMEEMRQIMKIMKLDRRMVLGTAGLGDLVASISSEHSQNRKVGEEISTQGETSLVSEGLVSISSIVSKIDKKYKSLPMLCMLKKVIVDKKDTKIEIEKFLKGF